MSWTQYRIKDVYEGLYDGPHATPPDSNDGAVFLGISNITKDGHIDLANIKYINENDLPKWTKRVTPKEGDGATVPLYYENRGEKIVDLHNPEITEQILMPLKMRIWMQTNRINWKRKGYVCLPE